MSCVLALLVVATVPADQTKEPGAQYAHDLARIVADVEHEREERITRQQLEQLEAKLERLIAEMRQLRKLLDRPTPRTDRVAPQARQDSSAVSNTMADYPRYLNYSQHLIKRYDADNDAHLDQDEWSQMNKDYSAADANRDQRLSKRELALYLLAGGRPRALHAERKQRKEIDPRYLKYSHAFVAKYDADGDGVLTQDEWSKMSVDYSQADTNRDGRITPTEMALLLMMRAGG
jgi:hypothetical protein